MIAEISAHDVIDLHEDLTGQRGARDFGLLDGAVSAAFQTFDGRDLHPTLVQKAAKLLVGVARAHAFVDGNKRAAWLACLTFLTNNGLTVSPRHDQVKVAAFVELVSQGRVTTDDVAVWLNDLLD